MTCAEITSVVNSCVPLVRGVSEKTPRPRVVCLTVMSVALGMIGIAIDIGFWNDSLFEYSGSGEEAL